MSIYTLEGNALSSCYGASGTALSTAYDVNGDVVFTSATETDYSNYTSTL